MNISHPEPLRNRNPELLEEWDYEHNLAVERNGTLREIAR